MSYYTRVERVERRCARELAAQAKDLSSLDELAQNRLHAEIAVNRIAVLLSVHKEVGPTWDWRARVTTLPPPPPCGCREAEMKVRADFAILPSSEQHLFQAALNSAQSRDRDATEARQNAYRAALRKWQDMSQLARGVLAQDCAAYTDALEKLIPLAELKDLGARMKFSVHSPASAACVFSVKTTHAIPTESKNVTLDGKLHVEPISRTRFHEIYADYICAGILRVAREMFALLPLDTVTITAVAPVPDAATTKPRECPVLSVRLPRAMTNSLDWDSLVPAETISRLVHRGDFKTARARGAFVAIEPLGTESSPAMQPANDTAAIMRMLAEARTLRERFANGRRVQVPA